MQIRIYRKREIHIIGKCISFLHILYIYIYMKIVANFHFGYGGKKEINERKIVFKDRENYYFLF